MGFWGLSFLPFLRLIGIFKKFGKNQLIILLKSIERKFLSRNPLFVQFLQSGKTITTLGYIT